jgi:hypothetical protein
MGSKTPNPLITEGRFNRGTFTERRKHTAFVRTPSPRQAVVDAISHYEKHVKLRHPWSDLVFNAPADAIFIIGFLPAQPEPAGQGLTVYLPL